MKDYKLKQRNLRASHTLCSSVFFFSFKNAVRSTIPWQCHFLQYIVFFPTWDNSRWLPDEGFDFSCRLGCRWDGHRPWVARLPIAFVWWMGVWSQIPCSHCEWMCVFMCVNYIWILYISQFYPQYVEPCGSPARRGLLSRAVEIFNGHSVTSLKNMIPEQFIPG